ncbi:hypothetical protein GQ457_02G024950 [Hibiscus cannabinus]
MTSESTFVQPGIPKFDGHYDHWAMLMENLLRSKEYCSLVESGVSAAAEDTEFTEAHRKACVEQQLKDLKVKNYMFQAIDRSILKTILDKDTAKSIWDSMKQKYQGSTMVKRAQLQALRREFEVLHMKEGESVDDYFGITLTIANKMKAHGESMGHSGFKPNVDYFRVFGCIGHVHMPDNKRSKLDDESYKCVLLGISEESKAYRLYDLVVDKVVISKDVIFEENKCWDWGRTNEEINHDVIEWEENNSNDNEDAEREREKDEEEAKKIGVKWIFKIKLNENGEVDKSKARLVAKGYAPQHGINYNEVFAPVARWDTIRVVIATAPQNGWSVYQLDVKSAFLHGELSEAVFVEQPQGYKRKGEEHKVYKLNKVLFMSNLTELHLQAAKRVLRYMKGTMDLGVFYQRKSKEELKAYIDSDYAGYVDDRKGTYGYVFLLSKGALSWSSKKQLVVTLSTTEVEFVAAVSCAC